MKLYSLCFVLALGFSLHAQEAKVLKAKGRRALIELAPGQSLQPGQIINLGSGDDLSLDSSSSRSPSSVSVGSREHSIGGSASLLMSSASTGTGSISYTVLNVTGRYGWNKAKYEYGPEFSIMNANGSSASTTGSSAYSVGGFFDFNFIPNVPGKSMTYGLGGNLDIGSTSSGGNSSSLLDLFAGGNLKWFPLGNSVALRGDVGLNYVRTSGNNATITDTGLLAKAGFEIYY